MRLVLLLSCLLNVLTHPNYSNFMRQQAMSSKMVFNRPVPVNRLVSAIADSMSFAACDFGFID
jgi:hypothetical protein